MNARLFLLALFSFVYISLAASICIKFWRAASGMTVACTLPRRLVNAAIMAG
eukprot:IDg10660t1